MTIELAAGAPEGIGLFIPPWYDILWSGVVFLTILFFFWKFAVPKFTQVLDERAAVIEGGIAKAENAQAEAAAQLEKYNELLAEARHEASQIRDQARQDGVLILNDLKEQATNEAARITSNASVQIEAERQAAIASLRSEVGALAIGLASNIVGQHLADDRNAAALVDAFLADIENAESTVGN